MRLFSANSSVNNPGILRPGGLDCAKHPRAIRGTDVPQFLINPYCGQGLPDLPLTPSQDAQAVARLLALCPNHTQTPLLDLPDLARRAGIGTLRVKDERGRMGLGSFKALGAGYAIAHQAASVVQGDDWARALAGRIYVTASAGNHGLSVAAGARLFGARAVIYLAETVPEAFAIRLRAKGATIVRAGATYEESMQAAEEAAAAQHWTLLSDSSWPGPPITRATISPGCGRRGRRGGADPGRCRAPIGSMKSAAEIALCGVWLSSGPRSGSRSTPDRPGRHRRRRNRRPPIRQTRPRQTRIRR